MLHIIIHSALNAYWEIAYSPTKHFTFTPSVYGRFLWGHDIPFVLGNAIGGEYFGKYLSQQLPFAALSNSRIEKLGNGNFIYGVTLKYGYVSRFGPLEASIGYSGDSKKVDLYVNLGYYF